MVHHFAGLHDLLVRQANSASLLEALGCVGSNAAHCFDTCPATTLHDRAKAYQSQPVITTILSVVWQSLLQASALTS